MEADGMESKLMSHPIPSDEGPYQEDDNLRHEVEYQRWEEVMEWREHNKEQEDEQQS